MSKQLTSGFYHSRQRVIIIILILLEVAFTCTCRSKLNRNTKDLTEMLYTKIAYDVGICTRKTVVNIETFVFDIKYVGQALKDLF